MNFGEKLKKLRVESSMTQEEVAKAIGVSRRTYISYEQDGRYPRKKEIYAKLAETLKCDLDFLMSEDAEFVENVSEQYGSRSKIQAEKLVYQLSGMFAGGELSEQDKDAVFAALQRAYVLCKEDNKKYTPKRFLTEDSDN